MTQQKYLYLEGIFAEPEIRRQLSAEIGHFEDIDAEYRALMDECVAVGRVTVVCMKPGRLSDLKELNVKLDLLQKSLCNFLHAKRVKFARLFFICDDDLLQMLGSVNNPQSVQCHVSKLFDNVNRIVVDEAESAIVGLATPENEVLHFRTAVPVTNRKVEEWMGEVVKEAKVSSRHTTKRSIFEFGVDSEMSRLDWIGQFQTTIILSSTSVWFTAEVEEVFSKLRVGNSRAMKEFLDVLNRQVEENIRKIRSEETTPFDRIKLRAVAVTEIQQRDIVDQFIQNGITQPGDFEWEKQMRFYWLKEFDNVIVVQCSNRFMYGYEFIGINGRLINTPLTERIYVSITQALANNMNCVLTGPPGVGKSETVKNLARTLAFFCLMVNCCQNTDYQTISTILSGLVLSGIWGCFDNFNTISPAIMSTVSNHLQAVRNALVLKEPTLMVSQSLFDWMDDYPFMRCFIWLYQEIRTNTMYNGSKNKPSNVRRTILAGDCK